MKKSLFTLAAVAAVMASCSNEEILVDNNQNQNGNSGLAIGFETFTNKATRGAENSGETETLSLKHHHDAFAVWGFKDVDEENYVFGKSTTEGTTVSYSSGSDAVFYTQAECDTENANHLVNDASGVAPGADGYVETYETGYTPLTTNSIKTAAVAYVWTYSPIRFWDKNSNRYDFYAAAPVTTSVPKWTLNGVAGTTNVAENQTAGYFTLSDVTLADKTLSSTTYSQSMKKQDNIDYMIADEKHMLNVNYSAEAVGFDFNHILSRLNITVKRGTSLNDLAAANNGEHAADAKLKIVKLEVRNMLSTGSFNESAVAVGNTLSAGTIDRWTRTTDVLTYNGHVANAADLTSQVYILQSLIMPQSVAFANVHPDGREVKNVNPATDTAPYLYIEYQIGTTTPETYKAYYNLADLFSQNVKYTKVAEASITVGTTDVSGYYVLNAANAYVRATGTAVSGVTYYSKSADAVAFNEGWQNNINLTIDATNITFTANTYKWAAGTENDFDIK